MQSSFCCFNFKRQIEFIPRHSIFGKRGLFLGLALHSILGLILSYRLPINIRHYGPSDDPLVGCNASAAFKEREYFNINLKLIQCTYVWFGNNYFIQSDIFGSILSYRPPINIRHYGPSYDPLVGCNASAASKEREYFNVNLKLIQCTRYNVIL